MQCPKCKALNPDGKQYCGDCGVSLKTIGDMSDADIRERIRVVLREELRDEKLVQAEATEAIVAKITDWAKLLGYVAGIPIAILLLVLGALGVKKYTDLWSLADAAEQKIQPLIKSANDQADQLSKQTEGLKKQTESLRNQTESLRKDNEALAAQLKEAANLKSGLNAQIASLSGELNSRVTQIQGQVDQITQIVKHGSERWPVKTGSDPEAGQVNSEPVRTTVEDLCHLPRPEDMPPNQQSPEKYQNGRARPVETTIYSVEATISMLKREADGDVELVLAGANGSSLIAEIPTPTAAFVSPDSRWFKEIGQVRRQVEDRIKLKGSRVAVNVRARVSGVGFFDRVHGQTGVAPNGIELHPVISITFLE